MAISTGSGNIASKRNSIVAAKSSAVFAIFLNKEWCGSFRHGAILAAPLNK
jgi:hypothetical protein